MSIRLAVAAKGVAVGMLALLLSGAGAWVYLISRSHACASTEPNPECSARESGILLSILFCLMLVLGPLLAWGFLLPLPGAYVIPPFLTATVDSLLLYADGPREYLLVAPVVAYPVVAALTADRRRKTRAPALSSGSPASP
jgi:hypothetical protein